MSISHLSGLLIWVPKKSMWPSVPQSITQILSHHVACVSLARGSRRSMRTTLCPPWVLSFFLSFHYLYDIVASCIYSCSILPPFVFTLLWFLNGGLVYWKKERHVPEGPGKWSCSGNKGAFRCDFLQRSGFFFLVNIIISLCSLYFQCNQLAALLVPDWLDSTLFSAGF